MGQLFDWVGMTVSGTPGTGVVTLGSAISGLRSFASAGIPNGAIVSYTIVDGVNREVGEGTYTSSGTTLTRTNITNSTNGGSAISATSSALVYITIRAEDIIPASITRAQIPNFVSLPTSFTVYGFSTVGDLGSGAIYTSVGASSTGPMAIQNASGTWFQLVINGPVNAGWFGMVNDGNYTYNGSTGVMTVTGTDNQPMIQAALDYLLQNPSLGRTVVLPSGKFMIGNTIHMGYGNSFYSIDLVSAHERPSFYGNAGTELLFNKSDRPMINVQGGRGNKISGITIVGLNYSYVAYFAAASNAIPPTPAGWLLSSITPTGSNPGGLQQHSPYCGICIDAYKGTAPTDAYPTVTYPAWTGIGATQYGKSASSQVFITDCLIMGFAVGVMGSPNGDGNGDFIKIRDSSIDACIYSIAICNTQSRGVEIRNVNHEYYHTFFTNGYFGVQQGELDCVIENTNGSNGYQLFDLVAPGSTGPIMARDMYAEVICRLGQVGSGGAFNSMINFEGFNINTYPTSHGRLEPWFWQQWANITTTFRNCSFNLSPRLMAFTNVGFGEIIIDGGQIQCGFGLAGTAAYVNAVNYTGGALVASGFQRSYYPAAYRSPRVLGKFLGTYLNQSSYALESQYLGEELEWPDSASTRTMTQFARCFIDATSGYLWQFGSYGIGHKTFSTVDFSNSGTIPVAMAWTNDSVTFEISSSTITTPTIGDIFYHINSGTILVVTVVGAQDGAHSNAWPITAIQQNNLIVNSSDVYVSNLLSPLNFSSGSTFYFGTSIMLPASAISPAGYPILITGPSGTSTLLAPCTIANLPAASGCQGTRGIVTNASQTTASNIGATLSVSTGANIIPVYSDGTNWKIG